MIYVLDVSAILGIPLEYPRRAAAIFTDLTDHVRGGRVCYCDEVTKELSRLARDEHAYDWAKSNAGTRRHHGADYSKVEWVTVACPELVDVTASHTVEPSAVYVMAQAIDITERSGEVTVVSEDVHPKPTRLTIHAACEHFGVPSVRLSPFLSGLGLA